MINNYLIKKNIFKFLIITLIFIFTNGVLYTNWYTADAAVIGKKKKGYSSKIKSETKKTVKKTAAKVKTTTAAKKAKNSLNSAEKTVTNTAKEICNSIEDYSQNSKKTVKTTATNTFKNSKAYAASVKPESGDITTNVNKTSKPLKAFALSSNNYYESRYAELAENSYKKSNISAQSSKSMAATKNFISEKSSTQPDTPATSKAKIKNIALSSNTIIGSDNNESYFNSESNSNSESESNIKSEKIHSSSTNRSLQTSAYKAMPYSLTKNARAASISKNEQENGSNDIKESKPGFFSKYLGNSESRLKWFPGLYLNLGANVLENPETGARKMWSKLGAIPRFSYNNISFAYDLTFYFDENNNLRKTDWDNFDDYIRKIYYIYYGNPGDKISARIEMIDDLTLGSGAIFRNYCGSLRYPLLDKKIGAIATYDTGYDDYIKVFVDDIASPGIYAASFELMPHNHIQMGAQIVSDNKVNMGFKNENISIGSLHIGIPLSSKYNSKFKIYEEIAKIKNFGSGMHTGVLAETNDFTFKTEFRVMSSNYIPNYFDTLYEMERHYKGRSLIRLYDNGERYSGWLNEFKAKIAETYTFRLSYEKDYSPFLKPHLSLGIDYTGLDYNKLKLSFNYDRKNLYYSNSRVSDAIYGLKARYDISDSSSMCYEIRHVLNEYGKAVDSINIETQLKF